MEKNLTGKITKDSISRAELHELVKELQAKVDMLENKIETRVDKIQHLVTKLVVKQGE